MKVKVPPKITPENREPLLRNIRSILWTIIFIVVLVVVTLLYLAFGTWFSQEAPTPKVPDHEEVIAQTDEQVENGIHVETGLVYAEGFDAVRANCTGCHSAKLVTQNRASREGWEETIHWMQRTQDLWDLGAQEDIILDYLAKYYAPEESARRLPLNQAEIDWYVLKTE